MMGRGVWERTEGGIGRVWLGRKGEQKGWRGLRTSIPLEKEKDRVALLEWNT
jgi:hypothetical protein